MCAFIAGDGSTSHSVIDDHLCHVTKRTEIALTAVSVNVVLLKEHFSHISDRSWLLNEFPDPHSDWVQPVVDAVLEVEDTRLSAKIRGGLLFRRYDSCLE
jgi:hypothetical protein